MQVDHSKLFKLVSEPRSKSYSHYDHTSYLILCQFASQFLNSPCDGNWNEVVQI